MPMASPLPAEVATWLRLRSSCVSDCIVLAPWQLALVDRNAEAWIVVKSGAHLPLPA
jgi:hypothetical protein